MDIKDGLVGINKSQRESKSQSVCSITTDSKIVDSIIHPSSESKSYRLYIRVTDGKRETIILNSKTQPTERLETMPHTAQVPLEFQSSKCLLKASLRPRGSRMPRSRSSSIDDAILYQCYFVLVGITQSGSVPGTQDHVSGSAKSNSLLYARGHWSVRTLSCAEGYAYSNRIGISAIWTATI